MSGTLTARRGRSPAVDWLLVGLWAAVIFVFSSVPSLGTDLGTWDLVLRKLAHLAEYAILGVLLVRATQQPRLAVLLAGLYAISDEVHQTFVEGRVGAPLDVAIDTVGAMAGALAWRLLRPRRRA